MSSVIIYRQPDSGNRQQQHNKNNGGQGSGLQIIGWIILTGIALYIACFLLAAAYSAIFILAAGSLSALYGMVTGGTTAVSVENILLEGACGAAAGFLVGAIRRIFKLRRRLGESFVSAVISRRLFSLDHLFV
ncbi:MAG: hypothetical protein M0P70_02415 [Desulfobulbaceae bacterium]|nr:hypothetical protein [Desulfobulbaceae bacterium]